MEKDLNQDQNIKMLIFKSIIWPLEQPGLPLKGRYLKKTQSLGEDEV